MGAESSAPPPPLLTEPWRQINWRNNTSDLQFVENYRPQFEGQHLRILLCGPVGAGKSSFINSVQSVLQGRMYRQALADNTSYGCFTKEYTTYKIPKDSESFYPFVFNDIMGLSSDAGVLEEDVDLALKGHMKDGYQFNPQSWLSPDNPSYNPTPSPNDCVHVLAFVLPASTLSLLRAEVVQKIRNIRKQASRLNIPQVVVLTKIDEACPEIREDLKKVYKVPYVKEKMERFSVEIGVPINCILPVKCYHSELDMKDDVNSLFLSAIKHILHCGDDFLEYSQNRF